MGSRLDDIALIGKDDLLHAENSLTGAYAFEFIEPLLKKDSTELIANVSTTAALLNINQVVFPVTINDKQYENSYVCSPYTACVSYALEEMEKLDNKPLEMMLGIISKSLRILLKKATINKVVCVNNWMLSTNLYPSWDGGDISVIRAFVNQAFPGHALMFRSLNAHSNGALMDAFQNNHFMMVPSRQVYIFDHHLNPYLDRHNTKIDLKALEKTGYEVVNHDRLKPADYPRIVELYNLLYIEKYSEHNPQFTEGYIAHWHQNKLLTMVGLRNPEGALDGIVGFFEVNGVTSAPLVGYDTSLPRRLALYRILMAIAIRRAHQKGMVLNLSSGAPDFKRLRGGVPFIEYSAVYIAHLPMLQRLVWKLTNFLLTHLGVPIMKAFKL